MICLLKSTLRLNLGKNICGNISLSKIPLYNILPLFAAKKVAQKPHGDKFSGSSLIVGKTDASALLLREKFSVF
jgi:hypothetical protein